jgi:hypothetical protein
MKILKVIFVLLAVVLTSCGGIKNYTLENNQVKVLKSTMSAEGFIPSVNKPVDVLKYPLSKIESNSFFKDSLVNTYTNYYINNKKNTRIFVSKTNNDFLSNNETSISFKRVFKLKKDKFLNLGYDFNISPRYTETNKFVLTIDNFKFDYSLLEIKKDYPQFLFSIQFIATYNNGNSKKLPVFIIPVKISDSNWLNSINYQNYYTGEFEKDNFKSLEVRVKEIYLDTMNTSEVDAINGNKTKNLPEVLKLISQQVEHKDVSQL